MGRNSPTNESDLQQAIEERFNYLQSEMATLKTMIERKIAQNEERNRQLKGLYCNIIVWCTVVQHGDRSHHDSQKPTQPLPG